MCKKEIIRFIDKIYSIYYKITYVVDVRKEIEYRFLFLEDYGFSEKAFERNAETCVFYSNGKIIIDVLHESGDLDIIIEKYGERHNILKSYNIFSKEKINALPCQLPGKTAIEQISIYAEFLKTNIDDIINNL